MQHCINLAQLSYNDVKGNPNVGAILVHNNTVIGSGYHKKYGGFHAERNAIASVAAKHKHLIKDATLYVTLEPCMIHGKTPPCTDAILENDIKNIVISAEDPNPAMQGKSLEFLRSKGIQVHSKVLESQGLDLIKPFSKTLAKMPYIILKFAQSSDAYFGKRDQQVWLSGADSKVLVHKWRTEVDAIMIGYQTALIDNPQLTDRYHYGNNPMRIVIDNDLSLPRTHHLWADEHPTIFITQGPENNTKELKKVWQIPGSEDRKQLICKRLFESGFYRILLEGGAQTIKGFIEDDLWDEARIITSNNALITGIRAPFLNGRVYKTRFMVEDKVHYIYNDCS